MTQQNDTQQHDAAGPEQPEQLASAGPEPAGSGRLEPASPVGPLSQPSTPPQPTMPPQAMPQQATTPPQSGTGTAPTLYGYEAVPEAYLAPPQPGQPRYGTQRYPGSGKPFAGRPGYGEPGYGQPAGRQPGYGRPAPARPGFGAAARRDPAIARPWQRLAAQTIDWVIIIAVSVAVFWSQLSVVGRELEAVTGRYPDLTSPAAQAALNSILSSSTYRHALLFWYLGMFGIALVYYWVQHAVWGATVGKRVLGVRVVRAADRSRLGVLTAGVRTVAYLIGPAVFLLPLSAINFLGGVLWAADAGLPLFDSQAQSLHDKVAGTIVVRERALSEPTRRSSGW